MLECEYCDQYFFENKNGLAEKTFHELLHDPEIINN